MRPILASPAIQVPRTCCARGALRWAVIAAFSGVLGGACATSADKLPAGLHAPDRGVVCDGDRGVCFDRFGPSIGLTEAFLGPAPARALASSLRGTPPAADFSLGENITCHRGTGPCRSGETMHEALTAVFYGPHPPRSRSAEAATAMGADWKWRVSRYSNGTETRPAEPDRYRLRLEPDGLLRARVDCNQAGGRYRMDGSAIVIEVKHSTMAACEPGSLDRTFLRDLAGAGAFHLRQGKLYFGLKDGSGTMEFER